MDDGDEIIISDKADSHDSDTYDIRMKNMMEEKTIIHTSTREIITGGTSSPASLDLTNYVIYDNQLEPSKYIMDETIIDKNIDKFYADATVSRPVYTEFTLLILYIKSQKHLYKRAASYYRVQQNLAVIPTIILSTAATLMSIYSSSNPIIHLLVTVINAVIALLVALLRYFSPETKAKTCTFLANSLHGLETKMNLIQYKLADPNINSRESIQEVEQQMDELTKLHKVTIPAPVHYIMPIISYISIFTFIRYINEYKYDLYTQYLNIKSEIERIRQFWDARGIRMYPECDMSQLVKLSEDMRQKIITDIDRIRRVEHIKDGVKEKLTMYRDTYHNIDELYSSEIRFAESHNVIFYYFFGKKKKNKRVLHPVIQRVLDTYDLTN